MILNGACGSLSVSGRPTRSMNHAVSLPPIASGSGASDFWAALVAAIEARAMTVRGNSTLRIASVSFRTVNLLQRVDVVLHIRPDALADRNGLQPRQPGVALIARLEQRRGPKRCSRGCRLADTVIGHQNQRAIVCSEREPDVELVAAVGAVGDPVPGGWLHRRLQARPF